MRLHLNPVLAGLLLAGLAAPGGAAAGAQQPGAAASGAGTPADALLARYCVTCHNERIRTAGLALDGLDSSNVSSHPDVWEKVVRKLRGAVMPPVGRPRPDEAEYDRVASWLEAELDGAWAAAPDPGRTETFHRLNAPSTATPSATCWRSISTSTTSCRPTTPATASTTSPACSECRSRSWSAIWPPRGRSAAWRSAARRLRWTRSSIASPTTCSSSTGWRSCRSARAAGCWWSTSFHRARSTTFASRWATTAGCAAAIGWRSPSTASRCRCSRWASPRPTSSARPTTNTAAIVYVTDGVYDVRVPVAGGPPRHRRHLPQAAHAAGRAGAGGVREPDDSQQRGRRRPHADGHDRHHCRAVLAGRLRGDAEPAAHLHLSAGDSGRGDAVRRDDPRHARAAGLPRVRRGRGRGRAARLLPRRPRARRELRGRHRAGPPPAAGEPGVPVPDRGRPGRGVQPAARRLARRLPPRWAGAGVAPVVLPVEQHSGRGVAGRGGAGTAGRSGAARAAGAADAGRSPARRR